MKIVVTGGAGMLGHNLLGLAGRDHEAWGAFHNNPIDIPGCRTFFLDLADGSNCRVQLRSIKPQVVIHTAGLTDVDQCEREPEKAGEINGEATGLLAGVAEELGARLVYISTDYVFDGERGDYNEQDSPSPVSRYGETKVIGEERVRQHCSNWLILRTTIYGLKIPPQRGMVENLIEALRGGRTLLRFADQFFTPVYTGQFSELILRLVDLGATGLFHAGGEKISRLAFAQSLADVFGLRATIQPVPFKQIEGLARRPKDSSLVSRCLQERFGVGLPQMTEGLRRLKEDLEEMEGKTVNDRRRSN